MGILSELNMVKTALGGHFNNKAKFTIEGCMLPIYVQFNPESYSVRESVQYNEVRGNVPFRRVVQFVGSVQSITSLSFRFDTNSVITSSGSGAMMGPMAAVGGAVMSAADSVMSFASSLLGAAATLDVSALTAQFTKLMQIDGNLHRPPLVTFSWGSIMVTGVVESKLNQEPENIFKV